jgi:HprK-related kinase B
MRPDLLAAFIKSPGLFYEPDDLEPDIAFSHKAYIDHLNGCDVYEISGGVDFDRATKDCISILEHGRLQQAESE